jgi:hypothetical protein
MRLTSYFCGYVLPAGMRVWVVYTRTRTRIPDGYKILSNNVPTGRKFIPYPPLYRVIPVGYSGFGYPLPSLQRMHSMLTVACSTDGLCYSDGSGTKIQRSYQYRCKSLTSHRRGCQLPCTSNKL